MIPLGIVAGIIVFTAMIRRAWREPNNEVGRRHAALALLAAYGLIACASLLGIFLVSYVQPAFASH